MKQTVDINEAKQFLKNKAAKRNANLDKLFKKASEDFENIVSVISSDFNPARIYQWGSLLNRDNFSEISDIDIAVEGLADAEQIFKLYKKAEKMTDLPLDIVEMERIDHLHQESIKRKGKLVYERKC